MDNHNEILNDLNNGSESSICSCSMIDTYVSWLNEYEEAARGKRRCRNKDYIKETRSAVRLKSDGISFDEVRAALNKRYSPYLRASYSDNALALCLMAASDNYPIDMIAMAAQALYRGCRGKYDKDVSAGRELLNEAKFFHEQADNDIAAKKTGLIMAFCELSIAQDIESNLEYLTDSIFHTDASIAQLAKELCAAACWDYNYLVLSDVAPMSSQEDFKIIFTDSVLLTPEVIDSEYARKTSGYTMSECAIALREGNKEFFVEALEYFSRRNEWTREALVLIESGLGQSLGNEAVEKMLKRMADKGNMYASLRLGDMYSRGEAVPLPTYEDSTFYYIKSLIQAGYDTNAVREASDALISEYMKHGYVRDALFVLLYISDRLKGLDGFDRVQTELAKENWQTALEKERNNTIIKERAKEAYKEKNFAAAFKDAYMSNYFEEDEDCLKIVADIYSKGYYLPPPDGVLEEITSILYTKYGTATDAYGDVLVNAERYDDAADIYFKSGTAYAFDKLARMMYNKRVSVQDDFLCYVFANMYGEMARSEDGDTYNPEKIVADTKDYADVYPLCYDIKDSSPLPTDEWDIDSLISLAEEGNLPAALKSARYYISAGDKISAFAYLTQTVNGRLLIDDALWLWTECGIAAGCDSALMEAELNALLKDGGDDMDIYKPYLLYVSNSLNISDRSKSKILAREAIRYAKKGKRNGDSFCDSVFRTLRKLV